jgi:CPA1 family monovalent cation:H+ antiporter
MVFLITGLQARTVISRVGEYPLSQLAISVAVITAVVIVARFVLGLSCRLPTAMAVPRNQKEGPLPPWQWPFLLAFTGVRGIVSLAAALAIPLATATGQPFPYGDLILFLTFTVILITLVGQGLMLPWVIR